MIHSFFMINRQGKIRLTKWYSQNLSTQEGQKYIKEINHIVLTRNKKACNFLEWNDYKIVYKRYASLYFVTIVDKDDNELLILELIHFIVEVLDKYFNNVCELDLIFNFHKVYYILDETIMAGHIQESSKQIILKIVSAQENLIETSSNSKYKK